MLGIRNSSQTDEFLIRGRHEALEACYISQSFIGLPKQSKRNYSDRIILFKQTFRDAESMHKDIGGYNMKYDKL